MWPYDYFNQYSGLINEFDAESEASSDKDKSKEKVKKVFIAKWYGDTKEEKEKEKQKEEKLIELIRGIETIKTIYSDKDKNEIGDALRYKLEKSMPEGKEGDININILGKIIESSLVICDISPMGYKGKKPIFNANVMAELGMALAWKMPEQVIILYDQEYPLEELPFDIRNYFLVKVDFEKMTVKQSDESVDLKSYIVKRVESLEYKKKYSYKKYKN